MQTIDVHDLPEPNAKAIAAMVESVRTTANSPKPASGNGKKPIEQWKVDKFNRWGGAEAGIQTAAEFDRLLDKFFAANPETLPPPCPLISPCADIYSDHD